MPGWHKNWTVRYQCRVKASVQSEDTHTGWKTQAGAAVPVSVYRPWLSPDVTVTQNVTDVLQCVLGDLEQVWKVHGDSYRGMELQPTLLSEEDTPC